MLRIDRRAVTAVLPALAAFTPRWASAEPQLSPAVTAPLSAFTATAGDRVWPKDILELAKLHVLDTAAAMVACREFDASVAARRLVLARGGDAQARLIGGRERCGLEGAVFANAMSGHAAEINDFSPSAFVQPGPSIVAVCLGLAEARRRSGATVLAGLIVGYEIACRIPKALGIRNLRRAGLANHAIGATFGSAVAAAVLLGLSATQVAVTLSYAVEQASGSWDWLLDTSHVEKAFVFAGMPARNGLQAALMAQAGFTGVSEALDRPGGWMDSGVFTAPPTDLDRDYLIDQLGKRFELPLVGYKRYPTGGPTQPAVQAMLELSAQLGARQVEQVTVAMPGDPTPFRTAELPALNLPYLMAIILQDGRLDFTSAQSKRRMAEDATIRSWMSRVDVISDPAQERTPRVESARVTVRLQTGEQLTAFVPEVTGYPGHLLSRPEVVEKAMALMTPRLGSARAQAACDACLQLDAASGVIPLLTALTP